jgi:allene oxide cyclase
LRRLTVLAGSTLAAAAALAVASGPGSAQAPAVRTIQILEREGPSRFVDQPPRRRPSQGDMIVFRNTLLNAANRRQRIGTSHGVCVVTGGTARRTSTQCEATLVLGDGTLSLLGAVTFAEEARAFTVAVVGGTGAYEGARGSARITDNVGRRVDAYDIRLLQ